MRIKRTEVKFIFARYSFWIGFSVDTKNKKLYVFPIPCFGFTIKHLSKLDLWFERMVKLVNSKEFKDQTAILQQELYNDIAVYGRSRNPKHWTKEQTDQELEYHSRRNGINSGRVIIDESIPVKFMNRGKLDESK